MVSVFIAVTALCRGHFRDMDNARFFNIQHDIDDMVDIAVQLLFQAVPFGQVFLLPWRAAGLALYMTLVPGQDGQFLLVFAKVLAIFMAFIGNDHAVPADGYTDGFRTGSCFRLYLYGNLYFYTFR